MACSQLTFGLTCHVNNKAIFWIPKHLMTTKISIYIITNFIVLLRKAKKTIYVSMATDSSVCLPFAFPSEMRLPAALLSKICLRSLSILS